MKLENECVGQSWYLNVDMQLFFLMPLTVTLLLRYPKRTCCGLLGLIVGSISYTFYICWKNKIKAYAIGIEGGHESSVYLISYYFVTLTRMSPYLIGTLVGKVMERKHPYLNKFTATLLWLVALFLLVFAWIGFQDLIKRQEPYTKLQHSAYNALIRPIWATGISIMIYVCYHGYGGIILKMLTLPHYSFLIKISYGVYLVHFDLQIFESTKEEGKSHFDRFEIYRRVFADTCVSVVGGFLWTLAFDVPPLNITNMVLQRYILQEKKSFETGLHASESKTIELPAV